mgnify:CR=1 FL=1
MPLEAVGYDPGSFQGKAALLQHRGGQWILSEAVSSPETAPKSFWEAARLPRNAVCALFGAQHLLLREIRHPFKEPEKIAQTIRFEAEPYLSLPLEQAVLQYRVLGEAGQGSRVLLMALPKEKLEVQLAAWEEAGLDPQHVAADAGALWNCYATLGERREEGSAVALLDLGAQKTVLALFSGHTLKLLRVLRIGWARREGSDPAESLRASVEILGQEIRRSWATEGIQPEAARVLLTGGGSLDPGLAGALQARLSCPVERFRFLARLQHRLPPERADAFEALGACAVGAALAAAGTDATGIDFRREEFRYRGRLPRLAGPLAGAALAASALLVALGLDFHRQDADWRQYGKTLRDRQAIAMSLALGDAGASREGLLQEAGAGGSLGVDETLDKVKTFLDRRQEAGKGAQDLLSVLDLLRDLFQWMPPETELTVQELQATQQTLTLKGRMTDENSIWALPDKLNRSALLVASPTNAQSQPDGAFLFTLTAKRKR